MKNQYYKNNSRELYGCVRKSIYALSTAFEQLIISTLWSDDRHGSKVFLSTIPPPPPPPPWPDGQGHGLGSLQFYLFAFTAAGVVPCGGRKTSPRTSTIVQFIFYFWSFEISVNILRNKK